VYDAVAAIYCYWVHNIKTTESTNWKVLVGLIHAAANKRSAVANQELVVK